MCLSSAETVTHEGLKRPQQDFLRAVVIRVFNGKEIGCN